MALYSPSRTVWTHPEDRYSQSLIAGIPITVNATQPDGTRVVASPGGGKYIDMDSGAIVGQDVVDAWLADTAAARAASPLSTAKQIQDAVAPVSGDPVAVYGPTGTVLGYVPAGVNGAPPDVSGVGPKATDGIVRDPVTGVISQGAPSSAVQSVSPRLINAVPVTPAVVSAPTLPSPAQGDQLNVLRRTDNSGSIPSVGPSVEVQMAPAPETALPPVGVAPSNKAHWVGIGLGILLLLLIVYRMGQH